MMIKGVRVVLLVVVMLLGVLVPAGSAAAVSFTNRTTSDGLGNDFVFGVYVVGSNVYAATDGGGLSVSTDGGDTFTNRTISDGLGSNIVFGVYAVGSTVYAATLGGLSTGTTSSSGGGSARAVPQVVSVDLDLEAAELPASRSQSSTIGSW